LRFINYEVSGRQGIAVDDGDGFRGVTCDKPRYPGDLSTLITSSQTLLEIGRRLLAEPVIDMRAATLLHQLRALPRFSASGSTTTIT
jgi:hypothetical protein